MKRASVILTFLMIASRLFAQSHAHVNALQIVPGERVYEYERVQGGRSQTFGTVFERISVDELKGLLFITYVQELPNVTMTDSIVVDATTFVPLMYRSVIPGAQDIRVSYHIPGRTTIDLHRTIPGQEADTVLTVNTDQPLFDHHWPHLLLYTLNRPASPGSEMTLPVFTYREQAGEQSVLFVGDETVRLNGSEYQSTVWETANASQGIKQAFWLDTESNRLIKSRADLPDGTVFWLKLKE